MKKPLILLILLTSFQVKQSYSQQSVIEKVIHHNDIKSAVYFLASDELKGRGNGTSEGDITARYIAEKFREYGITPMVKDDYLQPFTLVSTKYSDQSTIKIGKQTLNYSDHFIIRNGPTGTITASYKVLNSIMDMETTEVKDMIVFAPYAKVQTKPEIRKQLKEKGCLGWIELLTDQYPYEDIRNYFTGNFMVFDKEEQNVLPHLAINDPTNEILNLLKSGKKGSIEISVKMNYQKTIHTSNVIGKIEGTDEALKKQYIILSAHFDHMGVSTNSNSTDSIFNGARDNAIGTSGMIAAAKYLSVHPPKRSILLIGFTAEELGLLGSEYYANNPLVPLKDCVYNLNIDNAGYNDTGKITMIGSGRTNIDSLIIRSAGQFGLEAIDDPLPEQNFLERSDQVSFMRKGIPAMEFAMGMTAMDEKITKYYHQPEDEVSTLDMDYIYKYVYAYILAAENLANCQFRPYWTEGDRFEQAAMILYGE